ncbi:hypothetical protein HHK36_027862 [Tetracentron sinense]|uniref:DUF4378 domain-containing protein n=1 Tax=Tetracentron sinense TaxID=13715 RepID=A0A835D1F7_TETSI|nr:hypothetical protein HHK36_027862 [Tetracentron sinense]
MGRERYWGGGRSMRKEGGEKESHGCMSGVLQLFDFPQFQFALHQQPSFKPDPFLQEDPTHVKGVEAPRNSLESEEGPFMGAASFSSIMKEEDLKIPVGIRLETVAETGGKAGVSKPRIEDLSSESSSSPGTKTPNLVARLMGLDLLPDDLSPCSSSILVKSSSQRFNLHQHHLQERNASAVLKRELRSRQPLQSRTNNTTNFMENHHELRYEITGSRSLPDTPRISSARRSDVDPRLSLSINKENMIINGEFDYSPVMKGRKKEWIREEDENRSPSYYARQIVKQVKESVSRKVGLDITNSPRNREGDSLTIKSKKKGVSKTGDIESSTSKHSTPSCSPRLRFLEPKNKPVTTSVAKDKTSHSPKPLSKPCPISPPLMSSTPATSENQSPLQPPKPKSQQSISKCKKASSERFTQRLKKPPQTSETIRAPPVPAATTKLNLAEKKKCKKTPLSNDLLSTKLPQKQLSSCSSQTYKQEATQMLVDRDDHNSTGDDVAEFRYVSAILKRTGIDRDSVVSITRWFTPSHPLNPSIFHHLEHSLMLDSKATFLGQLRHFCNRRLLFNLIDEILVEILKPHLGLKPWLPSMSYSSIRHDNFTGFQLLDRLCEKIRSFPLADCQSGQDIDALVEKDLPDANMRRLPILDEAELIVIEIERDILDSLVHEIASSLR